mgnify:CR=1 FL=1
MQKSVELCHICLGYGTIEHDISSGRDREYEIIKCNKCEGSGRLFVETETNIKRIPFHYDYEKHRHELKRH